MQIQFKKTQLAKDLEELAGSGLLNRPDLNFTPTRANPKDAGYDLLCCVEEPVTINPGERKLIGTGVHIWIGSLCNTEGEEQDMTVGGFLFPRSSMKGLKLTNAVGLCDETYQGEYKLSLYNYTDSPITVNVGDKLVQVVFIPALLPELEEVEEFENTTERGEGGFGSTGL